MLSGKNECKYLILKNKLFYFDKYLNKVDKLLNSQNQLILIIV